MAARKRSTRRRATVTLDDLKAQTRRKNFVPTASGLAQGDKGEQVKRLQRYLRAFGYMASDVLDNFGIRRDAAAHAADRDGTFDGNTVEALRQFQAFNGLPVTGELDEPTLALMQMPRCGFPDAPAAQFVAQGSRWNQNNLTYAYSEFTPELTQAQVRAAITQAFDLWQAVTPLTFTEVAMAASPHIVIRFAAGNHGDGNNFDGPSGVLAHAFFPPPGGGPLAGDTHFDEDETWTVNLPPSGIDLVSVAAHEFGHALGLAHSTVAGALMAPFYTGAHRNLEPDDIAGIRSIYGSGGGWTSLGGAITSSIAVGRNADGRLEIFARSTDSALWHKWQTAPNTWSGWASLGGVITSNPTVGQNADGRLEVFVRGTDNGVWHQWQVVPGGGWSGWASLGGVVTSNIAVARNTDGRLEIFARSTDNAVWHKSQVAPGGGWSAWASRGGVITSDITAGQNADGRLEIFVRGTDNAVWHQSQLSPGGGWSAWVSLGGVITTNIALARNTDGRLEIFARGSDNGVWHKWQGVANGDWSAWAPLGGVITSDPTAAQNADGRIEIFALGTDSAVWHQSQVSPGGNWSGWDSLGGVITGNIASGQNADGRLEIFVRGPDQGVWHRWQTAPNNGWS